MEIKGALNSNFPTPKITEGFDNNGIINER